MTNVVFDVYPAASPLTGSRLARLTGSEMNEGSSYRDELNGTGAVRVLINGNRAEATPTILAQGNYVVVIDLDLGASGEIIGGGFLEEGDFKTLAAQEKGGQQLNFHGRGALAYVENAEWWPISYAHGSVSPGFQPREDGYYHWGAVAGEQYGDIWRRFLSDAQEPLRPYHPIPDLTYDFTSTLDSNGDLWPEFSGNYQQRIGLDGLHVASDLVKQGLAIRMKPWDGTPLTRALLCQAYGSTTSIGTNRTSATFASGKVRFAAGVNIFADLDKAIHARAEGSVVVVAGQSQIPADMVIVPAPGGTAPVRDRELFVDYSASADASALTRVGLENLRARHAATDTATFPIPSGNAPLAGLYNAGWPGGAGHFWTGDLVTLHTGTGPRDYNNASLVVAAINWTLMIGAGTIAGWVVTPELGSRYYDFTSQGMLGVAGASDCPCGPYPSVGGCSDVTADVAVISQLDGEDVAPDGVHWEANGTSGFSAPGHSGAGAWFCNGQASYSFGGTWPAGVTATLSGFYRRDATDTIDCHFKLGHTSSLPAYSPTFDDFTELVVPAPGDGDWHPFTIEWTPGSTYVSTDSRLSNGVKLSMDITFAGGGHVFVDDLTVSICSDAAVPPGSDDGVGSAGSPGCYASCTHKHPAQTAAVTPIADAGAYFTSAFVEGALQELGASTGAAAPDTADYLVGTSQPGLSAEIVVGTVPGGELGGTWATPTVDAIHGGSAHTDFIAKAYLDAKGDLITATADNTPARLPLGSNGQVLTVDTSTSTGLKWATVSVVAVLDDLTDVVIASPVTADRLRYDGSVWRNSALKWIPVTVYDPAIGNWLPAVDGSGNAIVTEAEA